MPDNWEMAMKIAWIYGHSLVYSIEYE